jgi:hypothetical protein
MIADDYYLKISNPTKRELFAAMAMQSILQAKALSEDYLERWTTPDQIARASVEQADALIEALKSE